MSLEDRLIIVFFSILSQNVHTTGEKSSSKATPPKSKPGPFVQTSHAPWDGTDLRQLVGCFSGLFQCRWEATPTSTHTRSPRNHIRLNKAGFCCHGNWWDSAPYSAETDAVRHVYWQLREQSDIPEEAWLDRWRGQSVAMATLHASSHKAVENLWEPSVPRVSEWCEWNDCINRD